jgi:hypothetical protein
VIELRLGAQEIMERVDDMLSWEAIASQAELRYEWSHFMRAVPLVSVGADHWGVLTPTSIEANEQEIEDEATRKELNAGASMYYEEALPEFLETTFRHKTVRYAQLIECDRSKECAAGAGTDHPTLKGDDVSDLESTDGCAWLGATYHLESIGEVGSKSAKAYQRVCRLPQTARVFLHQHVFAFADGRATSNVTGFGYWNRRFFELGKNHERLAKKMDGNRFFHPSLIQLASGIAECVDRAEVWGVELSLGGPQRTGVELRTDAIGARAFVKLLRTAETASARRKSVVHWVNEHMRRRRASDASAEIFVRGHLRGMQSVPCGRYHARIWPAQNLVDKAAKS